jgi:hypothetical protein
MGSGRQCRARSTDALGGRMVAEGGGPLVDIIIN